MKKLIYFSPNETSFIKRDIELLSTVFRVKSFMLGQGNKAKLPFQLLRQFFQSLITIPRCQIVVCQFAGYSSLIPFIVAKLFSKPRFLIVAGTDAASFPNLNYGNFRGTKMVGWFTKRTLDLTSHIFPVHESLIYQEYDYHPFGGVAQGLHYFYPKSKKVPYSPLYYGYDSEVFKILDAVDRIPKSFVSIGNLGVETTFKRKGFDLIIELATSRPDLSFTLIGWDGKQEFDFPDNVRLVGFLNQEEIVKELNAHEYYLQLSLMEGFPNALAEGMLCGCIPIGSNVSGIPYIIGETGYVLEKHDLESLKRLIDEVLLDQDAFSRSLMARKRIVDNFTYANRLRGFEKVFDHYGI